MTTSTISAMTELCIRSVDLMATGSPEDFEQIYHPQALTARRPSSRPPPASPAPPGSTPPPSGCGRHSPACAGRFTRPSSATTWSSCT